VGSRLAPRPAHHFAIVPDCDGGHSVHRAQVTAVGG